jgi:hypothetical protein
VGSHEDGGAEFGGDAAEEVEDEGSGGGVEVAGGFVGEEEGRVVGEGAGDGDALLLAAGELVREAGGLRVEADPGEAFECGSAGLGMLGEEEGEFDVFNGGEGGHELEGLEDEADLVAADASELGGCEGGGGLAEEEDVTGGGEVHGAGEVEEGGFAAAGASGEGDELAAMDVEGQMIECKDLGTVGEVSLGDVIKPGDDIHMWIDAGARLGGVFPASSLGR